MSRAEEIQRVLFGRLQQMTQGNGYEYDWTWYRGIAPDDSPAKPAGTLIDGGDRPIEAADPLSRWVMTLQLDGDHSASAAHDAEPHAAQVMRRMAEDIVRLVGSIRWWLATDELHVAHQVEDIYVIQVAPIPDMFGDGSVRVSVFVELRYRHLIRDPST